MKHFFASKNNNVSCCGKNLKLNKQEADDLFVGVSVREKKAKGT